MKTITTLLTVIFLLTFLSCQKESFNSDGNKIIDLDEKSALLVEADNAFGLELFQNIRKESAEENIMISPLSVSVALAMAYNGADSDTKTEMEKTLKLFGLTPAEINGSYQMLINALQSLDEKVVFELANAIFYADGFNVKSDFLNINKNYYKAEVDDLNFGSPEALATINGWVAKKTHDKIPKILEKLDRDDMMVLLNAIYFNGIWTREFDKEGTKMNMFTLSSGTAKEVPMMSKEDKLEYTTNPLFSAVKMPYGKGQYNMVVMLPAESKNSGNIINELNTKNWKTWNEGFKTHDKVVVTMPRFKFSFGMQINEVLKNMGMVKAFNAGQANFSKITDQTSLFISSVTHKSFIDVNENGTEAAAVTAVVFTRTSVDPSEAEKIRFTVNKPFVFAITEKDTGAILFIGEVQNPEYQQ